jgi:hypothetical protein
MLIYIFIHVSFSSIIHIALLALPFVVLLSFAELRTLGAGIGADGCWTRRGVKLGDDVGIGVDGLPADGS